MAEDREYNLITYFSADKKDLEDGEMFLRFRHWRMFKRLLWDWVEKSMEVETDIKPMRYKRSLAQNRWLWGPAIQTIRAWHKETTGEKITKDECYVFLNTSVLGNKPEIKTIMGEECIVMTGKRFSQMTTKEFSDAVDTICKHYEAKGLIIPLPQDGKNNLLNDFIEDV